MDNLRKSFIFSQIWVKFKPPGLLGTDITMTLWLYISNPGACRYSIRPMVYIEIWFMKKKKITWICGREKNWNQTELIITISKIDYCILYLAGNRSSRLVQILYFPFVLRSPCLSVCLPPPLLLLPIPMFYQVSIPIPCTVTMAIPGLWRHSAVVQCLCPFLILLCPSLCFVWLIMSGLSNSVSISKVVLIFKYFISLMFHSVFCLWFVYFSTVNFLPI